MRCIRRSTSEVTRFSWHISDMPYTHVSHDIFQICLTRFTENSATHIARAFHITYTTLTFHATHYMFFTSPCSILHATYILDVHYMLHLESRFPYCDMLNCELQITIKCDCLLQIWHITRNIYLRRALHASHRIPLPILRVQFILHITHTFRTTQYRFHLSL